MPRPDFTGEWTLNVEASALSPGIAPVVQSGSVQIEHYEPIVAVHLSITMDGKPFDVRFKRNSEWDGDALVFVDRVSTPSGEMTVAFRYELADHGRRLRAVERLRAPDREQDNVWVFDRPPQPSTGQDQTRVDRKTGNSG
jgi:hypothetical protein